MSASQEKEMGQRRSGRKKGNRATKWVSRFHWGQYVTSWVVSWPWYVVGVCDHIWTLRMWILWFKRKCLYLFNKMDNLHYLGTLLHREFALVYSWNHPGHARPYLPQISPWATALNFSTLCDGKWLQSRHVMEELSPLCSVSPIFSKSPFVRRPWKSAWLHVRWTPRWYELSQAMGDTSPASIRENLSAQMIAGSTLKLLVSSFYCTFFFMSLASPGQWRWKLRVICRWWSRQR